MTQVERFLTFAFVLAACGGDGLVGVSDAGAPDAEPFRVIDECGNGIDDDGDGVIDQDCFCGAGETQPCYPAGVSLACGAGIQRCVLEGLFEFGRWGSCTDVIEPAASEQCDGVQDDDCDGSIDEGCECSAGSERDCGPADRGVCRRGGQRCIAGLWGACEGGVQPGPERCDNGLDDDCDGVADEPSVCACRPAPELCDNGLDDDCDG
ncbi:MAG: MopE-related protein, partial [Myxococcota bacterium]